MRGNKNNINSLNNLNRINSFYFMIGSAYNEIYKELVTGRYFHSYRKHCDT